MSLSKLKEEIFHLIPDGSRVLDLGCGNGDLLEALHTHKTVKGYGIEKDFESVTTCIERGISVYHGDIEEAITGFSDNAFDVVILSQTLQQVQHPVYLLHEILRIGKLAVVSFPNFAHWHVRLSLFFGDIPRTKSLPYEWYNTPNIRVASISGFRKLCKKEGFNIVYEGTGTTQLLSNLFCSKGLFILEKAHQD
jgi:methionine biosynthesis protein MetW